MASDKSASANGAFVERRCVSVPAPDSPTYQQLEPGSAGLKTINGGSGVLGMVSTIARLQAKPHITQPFVESGWAHALIKAFSQAASSVPLEIWIGDPATDKQAKVLDKKDPLMELLRRPSPRTTQSQFIEAGTQHRKLEGEDFWLLIGKNEKPVEYVKGTKIPLPRWIMSVRGSAVSVEYDEYGWPKRYRVTVIGGASIECSPAAIVHFRDYNPDDCRRGLGDAEAAATLMDLEHQANRYQRSILANSGDPGGYLISKTGPAAPEITAATENQVNQKRGPTEAGKYKFVPEDVEYVPNEFGPRDMDFPRMREMIRDGLAAIFGTPLVMIGVLDFATLGNFDSSIDMFWNGANGVLSYFHSIEDVLNNLFLPNLDRADADKLVARFNTKAVKALQQDQAKQIETAIRIAEAGLGASLHDGFKFAGHEVDNKIAPLASVPFSKAGTVLTQDVVDGTVPGFGPDPADTADKPSNDSPDSQDEPAAEDPPADAGDGKAAAPIVEREAEPETTPPAPPAPTDAEVAAAGRRSYWSTKETSLLRRGENDLRSRYRNFRREYERATYARIRAFAVDGDAALRVATAITKADDATPPAADDYRPDVSSLSLPRDTWAEKLDVRMRPGITLSWSRALNDLAAELDQDLLMSGADPSVIAAINTQVSRLVDGHVPFLGERVKQALSDALAKATNQSSLQAAVEEMLPEITDNLRAVFGDRPTRAATIARTETAKAVNSARFLGMKQAGVSSTEWITSHDAAVRGTPGGPYEDAEYSHYELDGKTAATGFSFEGHANLRHPGDPDAAAGDTINCRCVARPVITNESGDGQ